MVSQFSQIKYKLASSDQFEEYLKAIGVGMVGRKIANSVTPVVELVDNGDATLTLKSSSTFRTFVVTFRLNEEFIQEMPDGRKVPTVITQEGGNKLVEVQKGDKPTTVVREFTEESLTMTLTFGDVICTRVYKITD